MSAPPSESESNMSNDTPAAPARFAFGRWLIVGVLLLTAAVPVAYVAWPAKPAPVRKTPEKFIDDDLTVPVVANPGYVGSAACAECHNHASRVETFKTTRHFWACAAPEDRPMPADFQSGKTFASYDPTVRFGIGRENGRFVQKTFRDTAQGRREFNSPIGLVYGLGGQFDEVYFAWRGNRLFELPVTWLHPTKEWAHVSMSPHQPGDYSRMTTTRCLECHATWVGHVAGTPNEYHKDSAILGVGCERCHGPARDHIAFHRENPKATGTHHIVHPATLNRTQQIDLCAQCHSNAALPADLAFTHRPGEPLDKSYKTLPSRFPEDDHVANQTKYLKESKCFQKSEMTCVTCHNPHKPTDHKQVADSCLKCHQPANCKEQPKLPEAVRDNCTGCHLPARVWMNVHFNTDKDRYIPPIRRYQHRIGVYPEATQEVLLAWEKKRPDGDGAGAEQAGKLTKQLVAHWLAEADKYRKDFRFHSEIKAVREAKFFDPSPEVNARLKDALDRQWAQDARFADGLNQMDQKRFPEAQASFNKMLEINPNAARGHARLGTVLEILGKHDDAVVHLQTAAKEDPNDPYPHNMLGWMAYLQNKPADAVPHYRKALEIDPTSDAVLYRLGLAYLSLDNVVEGRATFERLYRFNPSHAGGCQGFSHILRKQGEFKEAVRYARRAVELTESRNADILLSLCDAYADAGRMNDAIDSAEKALEVADNADLNRRITERLDRLKSGAYSNIGR